VGAGMRPRVVRNRPAAHLPVATLGGDGAGIALRRAKGLDEPGPAGFRAETRRSERGPGSPVRSSVESGAESPVPHALTSASFRVQRAKNAARLDTGGSA